MNELLVPLLPSAIWFLACGLAILILLIIFGYHLYQRSRMKALVADNAGVASLAASRDALAGEIEQLNRVKAVREEELLRMDADRRKQELLRADILALDKSLNEKRKENEIVLNSFANLDLQLARRKQALSRLDAEIKTLEAHRAELEPMEQSHQDLRIQLEKGNIKLAQLAEQELKVGALMHQARDLAKEIEDLTQTLEPLRHEKNRLRQFVEQARQASAVKNEQLLEQKQNIKDLEKRKNSLLEQILNLESRAEKLEKTCQEREKALRIVQDDLNGREEARQKALTALEEEMAGLRSSQSAEIEQQSRENGEKLDQMLARIQTAQTQLEQMLMRRQEYLAELASLSGRVEVLRREADKAQKTGKPAPRMGVRKPGGKKIVIRKSSNPASQTGKPALRMKIGKGPQVLRVERFGK